MSNMAISDEAIRQLFTEACTHYAWQDRKVDDATLRRLYDVACWPPTSMNGNPARYVFVTSEAGKERLRPALLASNVEKAMSAPLVVIVAWDPLFHKHLDTLFPGKPGVARMYQGSSEFATETAFRNSTLQGAYLLLAARALGLDCGAISGFDHKKIDEEFFSDRGYRSNFLINIGYAAAESTRPRGPRLSFEEAVQVV